MTSIFQTWLPGSASASAEDKAQLTALTAALAAVWEADAPLIDRIADTVQWIPIVKTCEASYLHRWQNLY